MNVSFPDVSTGRFHWTERKVNCVFVVCCCCCCFLFFFFVVVFFNKDDMSNVWTFFCIPLDSVCICDVGIWLFDGMVLKCAIYQLVA